MDTELDSALRRLVADGVLTSVQARAVAEAVGAEDASGTAGRRLSGAAEALAYAGAAVAGAAALALASLWWDLLRAPAQTGVLLLAAAALLAAGGWVDAEDASGPVRRLVAFCWFLATVAATGATAVAAGGWAGLDDDAGLLLVGVAAAAMSGSLARRRPAALLLVPLFLGLHTAAFGLVEIAFAPVRLDWGGLLVWSVSASFALLVWSGIVAPAGGGFVLAAVGALVGAQVLAFDDVAAGLALGLVTSIALVASLRSGARAGAGFRAPAGLGAAGLVVFTPQALAEVFPGDVAAPVALFTIGLVLLGVALARARSSGGAP